jgi:phage terminase small subunit
MGARGPQSEKNNPVLSVIDTQRQRLKPPASLKPEARAIFEHVVNHSAATQFKENEAPLLALYCSALHLARHYCDRIGGEQDASGQCNKLFIENARLATSIATKLRLTPQTRFDSRAAERKASEPVYSDDMAPWND